MSTTRAMRAVCAAAITIGAGSCQLIFPIGDPVLDLGTGGGGPGTGAGGSATCTDGIKNGAETGVDCGGTCPMRCKAGGGCKDATDCETKVCSSGLCLKPTCTDKAQNGDETDTDCGGMTCPKCAMGLMCGGDGDCAGGKCSGGTCAATCTDMVKNGDETDVDCGGKACPKCAVMMACGVGGDCATGVCKASKCVSNYVWAQKYGAATNFGGLAVDAQGDIFLTGSTLGPLDFGNGPMSPVAGTGAFAAKLGPTGNDLWSVVYANSGAASDYANGTALALDTQGDVFVGGSFGGTLKVPQSTLTSANIFVAHLNGQLGYANWATKANASPLNHWVTGLASDPSGNVSMTGEFSGTLTWNGSAPGVAAAGSRDIYLIKTDPGGALTFERHFSISGQHHGGPVAIDAGSNIVLAGGIRGVLDFGGGQMTSVTPGINTYNIFVAKLDPTGQHLWSKRIGDGASQLAAGVVVDSAGNIIIAGGFAGTGDFGGGVVSAAGSDAFVAKFDPNGMLLWAKLFGDASDQSATALAVDANGDIAIAGTFDGTIDFGGGGLTSMGSGDVFVAKLDPSGGYLWARGYGDGQPQTATALAFSGTQNLVVTGTVQGQIDFGNGPLTAMGGQEVFIAKLLVP